MLLELFLPHSLYAQLISYAQATPSQECCGYLLGEKSKNANKVLELYPIPNTHADPEHFFAFSPVLQLQAFNYLKTQKHLEIVGIYHSHPNSEPKLSQTDQSYIFSPLQSNLIISLKNGIKIASYRIIHQKILEEVIQIQKDKV